MNVPLQGTKRTLLPHAMPTLQGMHFIKMEFKSVPLVSARLAHTNMAHPVMVTLSPKTIYTVGVSTIKTVKLNFLGHSDICKENGG